MEHPLLALGLISRRHRLLVLTFLEFQIHSTEKNSQEVCTCWFACDFESKSNNCCVNVSPSDWG